MTINVNWEKDHLYEMLDKIVDCWPAEKVAEHLTRKFRMKFTRLMIIGKMNREFGGILIFLINYVFAWPDDPKSKVIRSHFETKYHTTLPRGVSC